MHIIVETQGADTKPGTKQLGTASEQRLRFALRRLAAFVDTVRVSYRDANGPRGGVDKQLSLIHI